MVETIVIIGFTLFVVICIAIDIIMGPFSSRHDI